MTTERERDHKSEVFSKALRDVIVTDNAVPDAYLWPKQELGPMLGHEEFGEDGIPLIDLGGFEELDNNQRRQIYDRIRGACATYGFFQVVNHGVDLRILDRIQAASKKFFDVPLETKEKLECKLEGDRLLGYGFYKSSKLKTQRRNWSEGLFVDKPHIARVSSTVWPEDTDSQTEFSESVEEYVGALRELGLRLTRLILNSLGVYPETYDKYMPKEPALMRLNHYPPCPDPSKTVGLVPHHDANFFTILHQGDVGGLQVKKDEGWVAVRPYPNAFAVNAGNMLQVISNDICKSVLHKAVVNQDSDRYSIAYFVQAPDWDHIAPLPELVDAAHPVKYRPFTWPEYLESQLANPSNALKNFEL
ncbi:gibberellin 3-beta-dioxygenase 4 isoform X2 [Physcomitrium patens]|nr:gibberellin 3-beta-dioxygenase 4-like isoform X2 [Physcomitrium patens]ABX10773.1 gibberellin 3-oxidase-like protein [Physcomitrium patens]|eukprot:XP_024400770.1 gibberellin 3-beta-dioxygenase 4-like isoform X2 [Physcomitrella patens]